MLNLKSARIEHFSRACEDKIFYLYDSLFGPVKIMNFKPRNYEKGKLDMKIVQP